ncbi:MAG: delta-60 repeat domain-containing protein, partial [Verrucomicrobiota bacterium]|nr:delta-60 repeat domain-containing protein [Verrucomicrobiota bacterium]
GEIESTCPAKPHGVGNRQLKLAPEGIYASGPFVRIGGETNIYVVRLNNDGSLDSTFRSGLTRSMALEGGIHYLELNAQGDLFVAGYFSTSNTHNLVKLTSSGAVAADFSQGLGFYPHIKGIAVIGNQLLALQNSSYSRGTMLHRLDATGTLDVTFSYPVEGGASWFGQKSGDYIPLIRYTPSGKTEIRHYSPEGQIASGFQLEFPGSFGAITHAASTPDGKMLLLGAGLAEAGYPLFACFTSSPKAAFVSTVCDGNGKVCTRFQGEVGRTYRIEASTDWINWSEFQIITLTESETELLLEPRNTEQARFFRARLLQ